MGEGKIVTGHKDLGVVSLPAVPQGGDNRPGIAAEAWPQTPFPRDLSGPGLWGPVQAILCFWAPGRLLTLLGGMLKGRRQKTRTVTDMEFPTSQV